MTSVNLKEARKRLGELVGAAERGETILITRRGRRVARLVPASAKSPGPLPDLAGFRAALKVKGSGLTDELLAMRREERS
jgi:prevent-host-death family protein